MMIDPKQKEDCGDRAGTAASESTGERVQVPGSLAPQRLFPCSDTADEDVNNAEDKGCLMDRNFKIRVAEDHKLWDYDSKRLPSSIVKDVFKVVAGTTWSNVPFNKQPPSEKAPSSCDVPTEGSPATQDSSEKQDTPTAENSAATPQTEAEEVSTTDPPSTSPATEIQGNPAMSTQSDACDEEDGPSGEDVESINTNARETPCGEDQVQLSLSDAKGMPDSLRCEEAIASERNKAPVGGREVDCGGPGGQDEIERSRMPDGSDIACGQGKAPTITMDAVTGSENLPPDTKSSIATTAVPLESASDSVVERPCLDDLATSLDVDTANDTSTESTESSQPSASEAGVPCIDAPLSSAYDSCSESTPAKHHDELSGAGEGGSPTGQKMAAAFHSSDSGDSVPIDHDINPDDAPCEHQVTEIADTVDTCAGPESEEHGSTATPDENASACQPDGQGTTSVSFDGHTNSHAITGADGKADDDSNSFENAVSSSTNGLSFLYMVLILVHFICPAISQGETVNFTSSNGTEIDSMAVDNGSESFPPADQSTSQGVCCIVAIGFIVELVCIFFFACRRSIIFRWYMHVFLLGVVIRACKKVCSCIKCVIKHYSDQQVEVVLPLTSAADIQNSGTNLVMHLEPTSNETTPLHQIENEHSSSSVETLSSIVSEDMTLSNQYTRQSVESGYHSTPPAPRSRVALLSRKDGRVPIDRELTSIDVLEGVCSPRLIDKKRRVDCSNDVKCTEAENCDPGGEFVSIGFRKKEPRTAATRWGVEEEATQLGEHSSELAGAGLTQQRREQTIQILPPVVVQNGIVPNFEPSPARTVAVAIDPSVPVLAFNAAVDEVEHDAPDPPKDVRNVTPVTRESSFIDLEQGLRPHVGLADEEVDMFQLRAPLDATPPAAQRNTGNSAPVYPPLPSVPLGNAELQPAFPPLPALPSTSTPMVVTPITHVP